MRPLNVVLVCNDQHGKAEGCVRRVRFGEAITLEAAAVDGPPRVAFVKFGSLVRLLRISGKAFPIRGYFRCSPTTYSDSVVMEAEVAAACLNFLKSKGGFNAVDAATPMWETWVAESSQFAADALEEYACQ